MPVTIDATVGGASANSFVTLAEAQAYCDSRLNESLWEAAATDSKNRALVEATRELCTRTYVGVQATSTQALRWPRMFAPNPDDPYQYWYLTSIIPQRIKDATCELALQFIKAGTTDIAALDSTMNVRRKRIDVLETEYTDPSQRATGLARFPRVMNLIRPLLASAGPSFQIVRG